MQKIIGVICLVVGLLLLLKGHDIANSIGPQFSKAFAGEPTGKATHYYVAGTVVALLGVFVIFGIGRKLNFRLLPAALYRR